MHFDIRGPEKAHGIGPVFPGGGLIPQFIKAVIGILILTQVKIGLAQSPQGLEVEILVILVVLAYFEDNIPGLAIKAVVEIVGAYVKPGLARPGTFREPPCVPLELIHGLKPLTGIPGIHGLHHGDVVLPGEVAGCGDKRRLSAAGLDDQFHLFGDGETGKIIGKCRGGKKQE